MNKKRTWIFLFIFILATNQTYAAENKIEIFHIDKEKVIKEINHDDEIQVEVEKFLDGISDLYKKLNPVPDSGYMVKVPLHPAYSLKNNWFNGIVSEVIVIFPKYENPFLLVFDEKRRPFFFTFHESVDSFLSKLNFIPEFVP